MPDSEIKFVSPEWLQSELRASKSELIVLDCRSPQEYASGHVRGAANFSIPSIMLRRLAAGKIELTAAIKCGDLKNSLFVLYNDGGLPVTTTAATKAATLTSDVVSVLYRRLKEDDCRVVFLKDSFSSFRAAFPEWCEEASTNTTNAAHPAKTAPPTEQLMGLRSLRISTPLSDSTCSSSAESSDCESSTSHIQVHGAPVEILPGLFLGNATHSKDTRALQKYNIQYILNVTPDLPNVFEDSGDIAYLQIPITDHWSQDLAVHFPAAIQFIDEARTKGSAVLVHCLAGVSRSVTVTLAYLMHTKALCLNDAFSLVRARKPDVSPNFHFMEQLHSFERQLKSTRTPSCSSASSSAISSPLMDMVGVTGLGTTRLLSGGKGSCLRPSKYSCACIEVECKCMQGVSPDSGIEFDRSDSLDRWTAAEGGK